MSLQAARPKPWLVVIGGVIGVFLLAPTIVVVVLSFSSGKLMTFPPPGFSLEWYQAFFASDLWTASAWTSLEVALLATLLATSLGTAAALGLERHRPRGGSLLRALMLSPLVVPVIILAIGMFFALPNLHLEGRAALAVAHAVMGLPFVVISVTASLHGLDPAFEEAARSLGAHPVRAFWRVTLPLILPGMLVGALFAFVASWDEVVVALFLTTPTLRTLPVTMWEQARHTVDPVIAAASSLLTAVTILLLLLSFLLAAYRRLVAGAER